MKYVCLDKVNGAKMMIILGNVTMLLSPLAEFLFLSVVYVLSLIIQCTGKHLC